MSNTTYYSVMRDDSLVLNWTKQSQEVVRILKRDNKGTLVSLSGNSKVSLDQLIDIGDMKVYNQETMDDFMNEKTCGDVYLDNAFTLIDDLECKYSIEDSKYSFEIYLSTVLAKKMHLSQKMSWMLMTSFLVSHDAKLKDVVFDYPGTDWKKFDSEFFDKLVEIPHDRPFENNLIRTEYNSEPFSTYNNVAKAFQDLVELSKIDSNDISLSKLQIQSSFELVRMSFELLKYFS
ncbi:hypothetical protein [Companilactobacillus hulinensis]|uniref:hypothetical protein n=1 Tax=Companilactobacillus hulinensis TaxID=2486007 RepID=UPI000F794A49|nr:hypothetical protein [Companilactobacillus hulinensis]